MNRKYVTSLVAALVGGLYAPPAAAQADGFAEIAAEIRALKSEIKSLHEENQTLRQQLGVIEMNATKPSAPAPASPLLKLGGELRLRYETFDGENPAFVDRSRFRGRLRLGGTAALAGNVELGLRLTTGVAEGEPTGNNATWQDNASKKAFALDLAYVKWTAFRNDLASLALTGGKMNNPFPADDLILDGDYTPEGFAAQYSRRLGERHSLKVNAAGFVIDELSASAHDPMFFAGQVRLDTAWSKEWGTSFGFTQLDLTNASRLVNSAVPDVHKGNTRTAAGALVNDYRPWLVDASVTRTIAGIPFKVAGDYMFNPGADTLNQAWFGGLYIGKAAKAGTWEFNYRYRVAQADCWYEELIDSDSGAYYQAAPAGGTTGYGGGTNVRGHIFAGNYAVSDYALVGFTYFATRLEQPSPAGSESGMGRLQLNTILKF
ncbi:MAG TPA: putative porin [Lacunisphaera sp.]|nr:putative porin [Lacunisphaera sp.]